MRVWAVKGTRVAPCRSRSRSPYCSLARTTIERPSGVSSDEARQLGGVGQLASVTPSAGWNAAAWRLPRVMVPVLSSSSVEQSPGRLDGAARHGEHVALHQPVHAGDADGRQERPDRGGDQAHEQGDQDDEVLLGAAVDGEGLQGDRGQQEDEREPGEQDVEGDLVRRLLARGAFDEGDHAVEERLPGSGRDAHDDLVREHPGAAGDRRAVAARLADHRSRLAGDGRLVDAGDALDDLAVAGDHLAGRRRRTRRRAAAAGWAPRRSRRRGGRGRRCRTGLAQRVGLRLAAALGHRLGEVGEEDGEPQPRRDQAGEEVLGRRWTSRCRAARRSW